MRRNKDQGLLKSLVALGGLKVWVFVAVYDGVEMATKVFLTEEAANREYERYAKELKRPFDKRDNDYVWDNKDTAWYSECEVETG